MTPPLKKNFSVTMHFFISNFAFLQQLKKKDFVSSVDFGEAISAQDNKWS